MRVLYPIIATLLLSVAFVPASGQEQFNSDDQSTQTQQTRRSPFKKTEKHSRDELKSIIDSLQLVINGLRNEIDTKDSLAKEIQNELTREEKIVEEITYTSEMTDSLLNMWYIQNKITQELDDFTEFDDFDNIGDFNSDSVMLSTNVPDSVLIERLKKMNSFISIPFNPVARNFMILYAEKRAQRTKKLVELSEYYFPIFEEVLNKYDLPLELKYLAIIESAFNPEARSRAGARGMWQFMYKTARQYGLKINSFVDERLDVEKSTDAAARYLKDLYNMFGDWTLAISSYNCGPGNFNKAIRRSGGKRDFWSIYPCLPRETRSYMPAFVGAMYAMNYYKEHGINPEPSPLPAHTDTFIINKNLHFGQVSDLVGVSMEELKEINPQYIHNIIPGNEASYALKLPVQYSNAFIDCQDSLYTHLADSLLAPAVLKNISAGEEVVSSNGNTVRYKVKNGDYLGKIASRYHVSVKQIMSWNNLRNSNLKIGQVLTIYQGGKPVTTASGQKSSEAKSTASNFSPDKYTVYTVKSGESLYTIAKAYPGISAADIMAFNNCSSNLKVGQKIKIPQL